MPMQIFSGSEAIALGAFEAGVQVVTGYPGTPSTEIVETMIRLFKNSTAIISEDNTPNPYIEWSINEKVAVEVASACSFCGLRSLSVMKNAGLNVALDFLMTLNLTGVDGGMLIVSADDVGAFVSTNEQDTRNLCQFAHLPVVEPADAKEAKDMTKWAFGFSEKFGLPVVLRLTGRVSSSLQEMSVRSVNGQYRFGSRFKRNLDRFFLVGETVRKSHKHLHEKLEIIRRNFEQIPFNWREQNGRERIGIIASGYCYNYAKEAIDTLGLQEKVAILKIGTPYPIPRKAIIDFLSNLCTVLVLEEVEPLIEQEVKGILADANLSVSVRGRDDHTIPWCGPINVSLIFSILSDHFKLFKRAYSKEILEIESLLVDRPNTFCAGCPHRSAFFAIKQVLKKKKRYIYTSDIGCYGMGAFPPLNIGDTNMCMGSSISLATGFAHSTHDTLVLASIGDSTFFHAGIPALINAVYNDAKIILVIHDNGAIGMTGGQPTPSSGFNAMGKIDKKLKIEEICKRCGVEHVKVLNSYALKKNIKILEEIVIPNRLAAIIFKGKCVLNKKRRKALNLPKVDPQLCKNCLLCLKEYCCPAMQSTEDNTMRIDEEICTSCGVCIQVCPFHAIAFS